MAVKKTAPTDWKVDEPYSPPYALPSTKPTPEPPWRVDEQRYVPAEPITRIPKRKISPTQPWYAQKVYTPSQQSETYYRNTRTKQTVRRKKRLV